MMNRLVSRERVVFVDLEETQAVALQSELSGAASAAEAWLPDAV
jgi:hypothetical protein